MQLLVSMCAPRVSGLNGGVGLWGECASLGPEHKVVETTGTQSLKSVLLMHYVALFT